MDTKLYVSPTFDVTKWMDTQGYLNKAREALRTGFNDGYDSANWADTYNAGTMPECVIPTKYSLESQVLRNRYCMAYTTGYIRGVTVYEQGQDLVNY